MRTVTQSIVATTTAVALTACGGGGSTAIVVRMPASEMEVLGPSTLHAGLPPPTVRTINGTTHQLTGPIQTIEIDMKGKVVPVSLPFKARIQDNQLEVLTDVVRTYPVQDISYVQLQYGGPTATSRRREGASGGLVFGGLVIGGLGTALLVVGLQDHGGGGFINLGGIIPVFGGGLAILGVGMLIAGISVGSSSSPAPPGKTTKIQPKLHLSPTGGAVSFAF